MCHVDIKDNLEPSLLIYMAVGAGARASRRLAKQAALGYIPSLALPVAVSLPSVPAAVIKWLQLKGERAYLGHHSKLDPIILGNSGVRVWKQLVTLQPRVRERERESKCQESVHTGASTPAQCKVLKPRQRCRPWWVGLPTPVSAVKTGLHRFSQRPDDSRLSH